jgi:hypothetical protein
MTGPRFLLSCFAGGRQLADDVSIWIGNTDLRDRAFREALLQSGVLQQCVRRDYRRFVEFIRLSDESGSVESVISSCSRTPGKDIVVTRAEFRPPPTTPRHVEAAL